MNKYRDEFGAQTTAWPPPLTPGEQLIWSGRPKKNAFIINKVLGMLPIAVIWLAFDGFIIFQMFGAAGEMSGFLIPFFAFHLMPVWIWLWNSVTAARRWKNTAYFVTNRRILIQTGIVDQQLQTVYYKDIEQADLRIGLADKLLGVGDIYFNMGSYYSNQKVRKLEKAFLDVENPHEVYHKIQQVILDIQSDIQFPNAYRPEENPGYNTQYRP